MNLKWWEPKAGSGQGGAPISDAGPVTEGYGEKMDMEACILPILLLLGLL